MAVTAFEVEQAGCASCAALVRDVLEEVATVLEVAVDESADRATVRLEDVTVPEEEIDRLLRDASPGTGHAYRVLPGSWRLEASVAAPEQGGSLRSS